VSATAPVIVLTGPTASGKTALALELAEALDGEIVSVDSALVYRGLDIGSAKPDASERARIPHHLIDVTGLERPYSAARFVEDALPVIRQIRERGRRPLLVGGTMLYFKALFGGIAPMPPGDAVLRAQLDRQAATLGWAAMHERLAAHDPAAAARIHPNDAQRIGRALEVFELSGRTLSELQAATRPAFAEPVVSLALLPHDRGWLHARIARRLDMMRQAGFDEEVRALHAQALSPELPALRSVGYRQALEALASGTFEHEPDGSSARWPARAVFATRQLAKRQLTWLRSRPEPVAIGCDALTLSEQRRVALDTVQAGRSVRLFSSDHPLAHAP